MFTSPQMTKEIKLKSLNTDYNAASDKDAYDGTMPRERHRVDTTIRLLGVGHGRWLDDGCGSGVLLREAEKVGFVPCGFEVRTEAAKHLREGRGWDVRAAGSLAEARFPPHSFEVVSIIDTLPFISNPLGELGVIKQLLAPHGMLVCRVMNARYLLLKNTGLIAYLRFGRWSVMNTEYHIIHFTSDSLSRMLKEAGFRIVHQEVGQPWLTGTPLTLLVKRCWFIAANLLSVVGLNLGVSVDVWAVPIEH
jgi:2-polyprenyl-3-methyl-5-hydroxy-6-metoxy-1,4-benzoquinol methylase